MAATVRDTDGVLPGVLKDSRGVTENFTNPEQVVTVDEGPSSLVSSPRVKSTSSNKWKSVKSLITAGNALTSSLALDWRAFTFKSWNVRGCSALEC